MDESGGVEIQDPEARRRAHRVNNWDGTTYLRAYEPTSELRPNGNEIPEFSARLAGKVKRLDTCGRRRVLESV